MSTAKIVLTPEEHAELSRRVRSATISQRDGRRARVILLASQGCTRAEISRLTGLSASLPRKGRMTIRDWKAALTRFTISYEDRLQQQ
ncbi:TPA: hypothetical protein P9G65_005818 [Pseudomonas aeruginosa]|nr:hypothetical protein [Pseudomonas aeruginosa]HDQ4723519.1 hypothetical protein [Pseudomonas aeruginosa]